MQSAMARDQFVGFLVARGDLRPEQAQFVRDLTPQFRDSVAALLVRNNLLDPWKIDELIASGEADVASALRDRGWLDNDQVRRVLAVQELRELIEVGEAAVIQGLLSAPRFQAALVAFLESRETKAGERT